MGARTAMHDDGTAFGAALTAEIPRLRRVARRLAPRADAADDLVQETLERAFTARRQFASGSNLPAWLFTILRNARAAGARRNARAPIAALATPPEHPVSGGQEEREMLREVGEAMIRLPRGQRDALWLVVIEGLQQHEATARLRVPLGTLRSRLAQSRAVLRAAF